MQDFPPPKVKRLQLVNAPDPTGENDRQRAGSASLDHSADRPKHNIIGLNCVTNQELRCDLFSLAHTIPIMLSVCVVTRLKAVL